MSEWAATVSVIIVGLGLAVATFGREKNESRWVAAAFIAHVVATFVFVWITMSAYESGDMALYFYEGVFLAHALEVDFAVAFPEVLAVVFHQPSLFDADVIGAGSSTGTMSGIAGLLVYVLGESLHAVSLCFSIWSYFGCVALYRAVRTAFPHSFRQPLLVATLFVPSVVYWTGGILKESVAVGALGFLVLGTRQLLTGRVIPGAMGVAAAAIPIAFVKPYLLFAYVVAAGVWLYGERVERQGRDILARPVWLLIGAGMAVGGVLGLGRVFPQFSLEMVALEAARLQEVGALADGGSNYSVGDPSATTLVGQLAFVPFGVFSTLFRPLPTEVSNLTMALAAAETTATSFLVVRGLWVHGPMRSLRTVVRTPVLLFCTTFVFVFAAAIGLSTTNLGTMSRYRVPLMPLFLIPVIALNLSRFRGRSSATAPVQPVKTLDAAKP